MANPDDFTGSNTCTRNSIILHSLGKSFLIIEDLCGAERELEEKTSLETYNNNRRPFFNSSLS